jgi:AcrR family transcriptional regulator
VLAATAALLDELPYETIGTKLIASRAGVSVGSLYRFFVDKQAIVDALVQQWLDRLVEVMDEQLAELPDDPVDLIGHLVDAYARLWRAEPGFHKVRFGTGLRVDPEASQSNDQQLIDRLHSSLTVHYGLTEDPSLPYRLRISLDVAEHLLNQAFKNDPQGDRAVLAELKDLLVRYLTLDHHPGRGGPARPRTTTDGTQRLNASSPHRELPANRAV